MLHAMRAGRVRSAPRPAGGEAAGRTGAAAGGAGGAQPSSARLAPTPAPVQRREALPSALRRRYEARGGVDLGGVTVDYGSPHPARYGAAAYTRGTEIHLAPDEEHNLAHEAWHAVQQAQGRVGARGRVGGAPLNDDPKLEGEADRMAGEGFPRGVMPERSLEDGRSSMAPPSRPADLREADGDVLPGLDLAPPIMQRASRRKKDRGPPNTARDQLRAMLRDTIARRRAQEQEQRPLTGRQARDLRAHRRFLASLDTQGPQGQPPGPRGEISDPAPLFMRGASAPSMRTASASTAALEADHIIDRIRNDRSTEEDHLALQKHMLNEENYSKVAADRSLFPKMYLRAKDANVDLGYRFSTDDAIHAEKSRQEIYSVYDQLHYILWRTGAGGHRPSDQQHVSKEGSLPSGSGLANRPFSAVGGTEQGIAMTPATARSVQHDALGRLIALYNPEHGPVRMPMYAHRAGPMKMPENTQTYFDTAAANLSSIMSTADPGGANIRVTDADRGLGAYISTDSDNYYGPNGFTFDPRDVHQLPLSKSFDNNRQHSSERKSHEGHQFRAMNEPIVMTEDERPRYSDVFASHDPKSVTAMRSRFTSSQMQSTTKGMLGDPESEAIRDVFQQTAKRIRIQAMRREKERVQAPSNDGTAPSAPAPRMVVGPQPDKVHDSLTHEQPKDAAHVYMMQSLVQEMNGLYEPILWADHWRNLPENRIMQGMAERISHIQRSGAVKKKSESDGDDSEWK